MSTLKIRTNVLSYVRDSYLGVNTEYHGELKKIDCVIGSSQWGMSERAMCADLRICENVAYNEPTYDRLLKPLMLERFSARGVSPGNLFFGHGSFNLAERLIHKLIEPSIMLGVGPQFNEIPSEFVAAGGRYLPVLIRPPEFQFPLAELLDHIRPEVSVVYIDNPNNPLGRHVGLDTIEAIAKRAMSVGAILIVDEAYGDFIDDDLSAVHLVSKYDNIAVLRSMSKCLGLAAARVGYMFLSDKLAGWYTQLDVPFEPTLTSAILARATLEDKSFLEGVRRASAAAKHLVIPSLIEAGFEVLPTDPTTSILTARRTGSSVVQLLSAVGVMVEPGSAFRNTHPAWDDSHCRLRLPSTNLVAELQRRLRMIRH